MAFLSFFLGGGWQIIILSDRNSIENLSMGQLQILMLWISPQSRRKKKKHPSQWCIHFIIMLLILF